jgi:predicted acyltransferase
MASAGLGLAKVAKSFPDSAVWGFLGYQTDHVPWLGCGFWDLIQPSFMFMVGVAMPYSFASRQAKGHSPLRNGAHVVYRSLVLVLLSIFLVSNHSRQTNFLFTNVLAQIGLGYGVVYLLLGRGWRVQLAVIGGILVGYWLLFALWPLPGPDFDYAAVGVSAKDRADVLLPGFFAHWDKNANFAAWFDRWFLNLFPRAQPFLFEEGGYATLNFVPSIATMAFGLMAGEWLRGRRSPWRTLAGLAVAGLVFLAVGWLLDAYVCPSVKRIWTPSWAVFSTGWTLLMLAGFYWVIDIQGWRAWAFPLVVVGMNSIVMYCMAQLMKGWVRDSFKTHLGQNLFDGTYGPIVDSVMVLAVLWLVCLWLYRRKVFVRI